ncbi:MAG: glutamine synthetase family protein [Gammaproteobacteria bacterium]|jgi:glutamine synthetase|nr:glutamine synthetase family protein [Gammaproteobacteria bacterium]MDX2461458.1 glutamine synthetase family protein [Gammaproteobacteria bacterium]
MSTTSTENARLAELAAFLASHPHVDHVDACLVDVCGIIRGKRYPRADLERLFRAGVQFPYSTYLLDVTGNCSDPCGRGISDGDPDGICLPIPGTLVPTPWAGETAAQVLVTMAEQDGAPATMEPRNVAAAVYRRFAELGFTPVIAFELEFFLLDAVADANGRPQPPISPLTGLRDESTQVYGVDEVNGFAQLFADVERAATAQNLPASVTTAEFAPGQYEINLRHVDSPLAAADHCALLRHMVKGVARGQGMRATFMPKPFADRSGSGMHVHMSLLDRDGRNVFDDGSVGGGELLKHAIGGMLATMGDAMAVFSPGINGYRRFRPRRYVPVTKSWGIDNRSVALRVPTGSPASRRFEHRVAGADANPYLVLAVLLAGVHHGLTEKVDPGPPWSGSACEEADESIPRDLPSALASLRGSHILKSYLGETYVDLYCATKEAEYASFLDHTTPREYQWYL